MRTISTFKSEIFATIVSTLALVVVLQVNSLAEEKKSPTKPKQKPIVTLTIDYGDGMQKRFPIIPWKEKMTVIDAMEWADKHPRGIGFSSRGKGATKLINQIDDLKNGGGQKKNWIFRVNDKMADRSCGVFPLKEGDRVLWRFEEYK